MENDEIIPSDKYSGHIIGYRMWNVIQDERMSHWKTSKLAWQSSRIEGAPALSLKRIGQFLMFDTSTIAQNPVGTLSSKYAINNSSTLWTPGQQHAICKEHPNLPLDEHLSPVVGCSCGFYAFYTLEELKNSYVYKEDVDGIVGVMIGWGRTLFHEEGFRTQWAKIIAFAPREDAYAFPTSEAIIKRMAGQYGVPIIEMAQLPIYAKEFGEHWSALEGPVDVKIKPRAVLSPYTWYQKLIYGVLFIALLVFILVIIGSMFAS